MRAISRHHVSTLADYFATEALSPQKHEFCDGQIYVMAGGSRPHNYVVFRFMAAVARQLEGGPCFGMSADQRISTADGLYTYPDGSIFCGAMTAGEQDTATNPVVLLEVLSDATRAYDRGEKLDRYKSIPTLRHVVLVEPDGVDIEVWSRGQDAWTRTVCADRGGEVRLDAIGVELTAADLYDGIERVPR